MKIKLRTLSIMTCDFNKKKHYRFIKDMKEDQLIRKFVPNEIEKELSLSKEDRQIEIGSSYIVVEDKKLIGYIRFKELNESGILTLNYGVHPDLRRKGYGTKILKEVSDYTFKSIDNVDEIKLYIRSINKGSIKCALNANFYQQNNGLVEEPLIYVKTK